MTNPNENNTQNKNFDFHTPDSLLDAFAQVFESSRGSQLSDEYLKSASLPLNYISEKMGTNLQQGVLLSIALECTELGGARKEHFCRHLGFDGIFVYRFLNEMNSLAERGIIDFYYCEDDRVFHVTQHAKTSIVDNAAYAEPEKREKIKPEYNDDDYHDI